MDDLNEAFFNANFSKEIARSLIISAATTAGMMVGMTVVTLAAGKVKVIRENRKSKKTPIAN